MMHNVRMISVGALGLAVALVSACKDADKVVAPVRVAAMSITAPATQIDVGQNQSAVAVPIDANSAPLTGRVITWRSSNNTIATVVASSNGSIGTITGHAAGNATITAASEGVEASVNFAVIPHVSVSPFTASPSNSTLTGIGASQLITSHIYTDSATTVTYNATSSNTAIATVVSGANLHTVTARGTGVATITMTATMSRPGATTVVETVAATVVVMPAAATAK